MYDSIAWFLVSVVFRCVCVVALCDVMFAMEQHLGPAICMITIIVSSGSSSRRSSSSSSSRHSSSSSSSSSSSISSSGSSSSSSRINISSSLSVRVKF